MKQVKTSQLTAFGMALMLFAAALTFAQSESQSTKKLYHRNGSEGSLTGTVSLSGAAPKPRQIDMSADPVCYENNPKPFTESIVGTDGHLANVLIYVKTGAALEGLSFDVPAANGVLEQRGCRDFPHVLGVQVNQTFEVRNADNTTHNVHAMPKNNVDWNYSQAPLSEPLMTRFTHSEIAIPIKNNQHPWMKAYVGVFEHPFFAVTDNKGTFTIEGLPPGNYTFAAWHEEFGEKRFDVTIYPNSLQNLDVNFDMADRGTQSR
jgi:hypothetical protein